MKTFSKLIALSLAALASFQASASISTFQENQGKVVSLENFEPKSIYGQWTLSSGQGFSSKWMDSTFYTIDFANLDYFKEEALTMGKKGASQMDIQLMWGNKESIEQSLTYYAQDDYAVENDPKMRNYRIVHAFRRNPDIFENFKDTHDQRSILIKGYNSMGGAILSEPYVPYNFNGNAVRRNDAQADFQSVLDKLKKEKPNFDFFKSVDLHFIHEDVIYGLDIVDDETIIIYQFLSDLNAVVLKKVPADKLYDVKGYRQILNELQK